MGTYLWQNFLVDNKIKNRIAEKIWDFYSKSKCQALIEIGPWKWALTKLINQISDKFFVIEKDPSLKENLSKIMNYELWIMNYLEGDVLEIDVEKILKLKKLDSKKTLVVGNLPYYITSPILRKFFWNWNQNFAGWIFMVQKEVGEKIKSDANKKSYLRWLLNYAYDVQYLKTVPAKAFKPVPKVDSCLIKLWIRNYELWIEWNDLIRFLDLFAPYSRKTLWKISKMVGKKMEIKFEMPLQLQKKRLEEIDWNDLRNILKK